jgi:hypothetical protein
LGKKLAKQKKKTKVTQIKSRTSHFCPPSASLKNPSTPLATLALTMVAQEWTSGPQRKFMLARLSAYLAAVEDKGRLPLT